MEEGRNLLDPFAKEFYPSVSPQFALPISQIYLPYPPLPVPVPVPVPPPPPPYVSPSHASDSPTRAVLLTMVPPHADEPEVRSSMQLFGGVRAVDMGPQGIATVHFFDLRSAEAAVAEVRDQHVRFQHGIQQHHLVVVPHSSSSSSAGGGPRGLVGGHPVWAQFGRRGVDSPNQGSLFVIVSDPSASADEIRDIFQIFGSVKEVREAPSNPHRKFIEFFDIRDAARALAELNGKEVFGRRLLVEFSKPGTGAGQMRSSIHKRMNSSGHHNFPVPPRLRSGSQSWSDAGSSGGGGSGNQVVLLKRNNTDAKISNVVPRNGNPGSSRRSKVSPGYPSSSQPSSSSSSKQQQMQLTNSSSSKKNWKNHPKNRESRFLFKQMEGSSAESAVAAASCSRDSRTTVMIKNIPNKYSQKLLLNMLDNHCIHCNEQIGEGDDEQPLSAYDFVYLPIDFNNKCNVGYGFVNLTSPEATWRLYRAFDNQPWEVFNSRKICQVTYARLQGLEALKEHFKNSKFACDNDEYMPVVFCPARDGQQLTDPVPIGGQRCKIRAAPAAGDVIDMGGGASSTTTSTHAPSEIADGGDDDVSDGDGGSSGVREEFLQLSFDN